MRVMANGTFCLSFGACPGVEGEREGENGEEGEGAAGRLCCSTEKVVRCVTMREGTRYTKVKHERSHGGDPRGTKLKNLKIKEDVRACSEGTQQIHRDGQERQRADSTTIGNQKKSSSTRTRKQKAKKKELENSVAWFAPPSFSAFCVCPSSVFSA